MIERIGVIGAGQMGAGIAQVAAAAQISVVVFDISDAALAKGRAAVDKSLARLTEKGAIEAGDAEETRGRIHWDPRIEKQQDRDFVIEAVSEDEGLKLRVFEQLDQVCGAETILASNTSSISITRLAAGTERADRFIGMHFMNPVPIMKLVEVIRGVETSDATFEKTQALAQRLDKVTSVSQDYPGFIANRILMPMINEAFFALMEGVGTAEDIDATLKLGANHPLGPLALADLIGLDTCLSIMTVLHLEMGDSKYRPCPLLKRYVDAGRLGRKSGRGVYEYA